MSNPAEFWSKIGERREIQSSSSILDKTPTKTASIATSALKKFGGTLVFKTQQKRSGDKISAYTSTLSGPSSPVTSNTANSWADSVEEEEAEAAGHAFGVGEKSREYTMMIATVARQIKRLEETEVTLNQQAQRITQLDREIKDQAICMEELKVALEDKNKRVTELEATITEQKARLANLLDQTHKAGHLPSHIDEDLEKKTQSIKALERGLAKKVILPDSDSSTEVELDEDAAGETPMPHKAPHPEPNFLQSDRKAKSEDRDESSDTTDTVSEAMSSPAKKSDGSQKSRFSENEFPALSTSLPTFHSPPSVRYVTAANIKKVPPPPPARTLKLGIDPAKFQKKQIAGSSGLPLTVRRVTNSLPEIDVSKDIRQMSKEEREPYGRGPIVQIMMGKEIVGVLPKYMFMQVSTKAFKYWTENPTAQTINFEAGCMNKDALDKHVEWLAMHTRCNKVFSVSLRDENDDRFNLELLRVARVLGLHGMYMGHFTRLYCQKVRDGPSDELVTLIEELAYKDEEPVFDCLAHFLAMSRSKSKATGVAARDQQLARLPKLAKEIEAIQARKKLTDGSSRSKAKGSLPPTVAAEKPSVPRV